MLILERQMGESVFIGGNIEVTVAKIEGNRVLLGFDAPSEVGVWRSELCPNTTGTIPGRHNNGDEPLTY